MSKKFFSQGPSIQHQWNSGATLESLPVTGAGTDEREAVLTYQSDRAQLASGPAPYKVPGIKIRISGTNTAVDTAVTVPVDDLGKCLAYAELETKGLGLLAERSVVTGPALWNIFMPALRRGRRGRNSGVILGHEGSGSTITNFFVEFEIPFTNESAIRPNDTARLITELQDSILRVRAAASTCFGTAHTVSAVKVTVMTDTVIDMGKKAWELPGVLAFTRYMRTANAGATQIQFDSVGKATGPSGTGIAGGSKIVFAIMPGSNFGLPGPSMFNDVTRFGVPLLHQSDTVLPEQQQSQMVDGLDLQTPAENVSFHAWPLMADVDEGTNTVLNNLFGLLIVVSGKDVKSTQLPTLRGENLIVNLVKTAMPSSGQWYLFCIELRDYNPELGASVIRSFGVDPDSTKRKTTNGHNPTGEIEQGLVDRQFYQGQPVQM